MFLAKRILFLYVETPLHAGTGRGLGAVDLPLQRERTTGYPMIQASGLKGRLRAAYRQAIGKKDDDDEVTSLFGKAGETGESFAGAIAPGDAHLLLFPVRSLAGVFAWTTSVHALASFRRSADFAGMDVSDLPDVRVEVDANSTLIGNPTDLKAGDSVVLEEFSFTPKPDTQVTKIGEWLAKKALPNQYTYWKESFPKKLCILPENAFRDFCLYATEVQTHVHLDEVKKTVLQGQLWTTESLPLDTLLYAPLFASGQRNGTGWPNGEQAALASLKKLKDNIPARIQLGGDETTGQGWVSVTYWGGAK
ncbi:MAG: type III-B CRISPR module RAMP protein Cmr4 [Anaerolineales bacterium]